MKDPDWLLDLQPREVQLEALRRSYRGRRGDGAPLPHNGKPAAGWGHFMEMRLGKTATVLNEFMLFKRDYGINRVLVVCPNSLKETWSDEAKKLGVDVPRFILEASAKKQWADFASKPGDGIVFMNYEALCHKSLWQPVAEWLGSNSMLVIDESVKVKNHQAITTKTLMLISKQVRVVRALTGLPAPQNVTDLWSQMRLIRMIPGMNYYQFKARYAVLGGFKGKEIKGVKNEEELNQLLATGTFVASRKDWGGYLPTDYHTVPLEMAKEQKEAYVSMEREFVVWLTENKLASADIVLTKYAKLQQISSGFVIDDDGEPNELLPFDKTPKFRDLIERLREFINGKTIVVCRYSHTADMLTRHLADFNPAVIRGASHMRAAGLDVTREKERFNLYPDCRVLVANVAAIKYGHTLIGTPEDPCSTVVFYENSYSLDDRAQAEQRPQGFSQTTGTYIVDYASTPIEARIIDALQHKKRVSDIIIGNYAK